ncbi:MAG TPA: HYR domain-containing protein [Gemmatimonadaceae bacterium]|nr:HYR domain-containing protein [Gemmatimonadaceae bacterium]
MIRRIGFSGFQRVFGMMTIGAAMLAAVSSCSETTAPEMAPQPSSDGVSVIEFNYPDSIKNPLNAGVASRLLGNGLNANLVAPSVGSFAAASGAPMYTVAAVPFEPEAAPGVNVPKICDDCVIVGVPLGFTFAFYGQNFDKLTIGTNGIVGFGALDANGNPSNMTDGCCASRFIHLKDANNNIIALGWADWVPVTVKQIRYETRGAAPNRRFILQFTNVGENGGNGHITAQLVLYESSNEIALYTTELSTTLVKRTFTQGIENLPATEAQYIAGRDSAKFALANDGVKFTPVSANKPPVITAPSNISLNADAACVASSVLSAPSFTDDAPGASIKGVRSDGFDLSAAYPKGVTTVKWTATDVEGLQSSVDQTVTVTDKEKPVLTAPDNISVRVNVAVSFASVSVGTAAVTSDNCKDAVVSGARSDNAPLNAGYPIGVTTITWTALDASGNSASATQTVTVAPNVAPKLVVPANIVVNTDARACVANVASLGTPAFKDDLDGVKIVGERSDRLALDAPYPKGMTTVHWTATDADGASVSADQLVTVNDMELPALEGVSNISVRQDRGVPRASVALSQPGVSDNCGNVEVSAARSDNMPLGSVFQVGVTTVTWTAKDGSQNIAKVSQTVTVVGNVAPVISPAENIVVSTDRGLCAASVNVGAPVVKDDIDGWSLAGERSDDQPLNAAYPKGVTTVKWTATDYDYATSSASQTVTVQDKEKPSIVAPRSLSVPNDRGLPSAVIATGSPSVEENCPLVRVDGLRSDGASLAAAYPVGVTSITWTATDASGNSASAVQTITVRDVEAPSLVVPADFSVNATSRSGAVVTYSVNASDNVGVVSLVCAPSSGSVFAIGYKEIDCVARDAAGNSTSGEFGVKVLSAHEQVLNLIDYIGSLNLRNGAGNPLVNQLRAVDGPQACKKMDDFVHMLAVKDGSLSSAQSAYLLSEAKRIQSVLGCVGASAPASSRFMSAPTRISLR